MNLLSYCYYFVLAHVNIENQQKGDENEVEGIGNKKPSGVPFEEGTRELFDQVNEVHAVGEVLEEVRDGLRAGGTSELLVDPSGERALLHRHPVSLLVAPTTHFFTRETGLLRHLRR